MCEGSLTLQLRQCNPEFFGVGAFGSRDQHLASERRTSLEHRPIGSSLGCDPVRRESVKDRLLTRAGTPRHLARGRKTEFRVEFGQKLSLALCKLRDSGLCPRAIHGKAIAAHLRSDSALQLFAPVVLGDGVNREKCVRDLLQCLNVLTCVLKVARVVSRNLPEAAELFRQSL